MDIDILYIYIACTLGFVLGAIFIVHGWRPASPETNLLENPTLKNFLAILVGSSVTGILDRFSDSAPPLLEWYLASVLTSIIVLGLLALITSFLIARHRILQVQPALTKWESAMESLTIALDLVLEGLWNARDKLDFLLYKELYAQKRFFVGILGSFANQDCLNGLDRDEFLNYLGWMIELFIILMLEREGDINEYRGCIYLLNSGDDQLTWLTGVGPDDPKHAFSQQPLALDGSLAGHAIKNPGEPLAYPQQDSQEVLPFQQRDIQRKYRSVLAYGIHHWQEEYDPHLVLCIDCISLQAATHKAYKQDQMIALGEQIAIAQALAGFSPDDLRP